MNDNATPQFQLLAANTSAHWLAAAALLRRYWAELGADHPALAQQELNSLPGLYAPPLGHFVLALVDDTVVGCAGLRPRPDADPANACELCRLYVDPDRRGLGLGRTLALELIDRARACGYSAILFDALSDAEAARSLYESLGFEATAPFDYTTRAGQHTMLIDLDNLITKY